MNTLAAQPKLHLYGKQAGLTIEGTTKSDSDGLIYTVNLDVAPLVNERVDWSQKISAQLSHNELVQLAGVLLGYAPSLKVARPGKGIDIERQSGNIFIRATQGRGRIYALPLNIGGCARIADFCLMQLVRGSYSGSAELVLATVRGACALNR